MITFSQKQKKPRKIIAIGIGGAGYNVINDIVRNSVPGVETYFIDSNKTTIKDCLSQIKYCIPRKLVGGLGGNAGSRAVNSPEVKALKENLKCFVNSLPPAEMVFTISGLGGGVGTIIMPLLIPLLKQRRMWVWSLVTLPFFFEGKTKIINSLARLRPIYEIANAVMVVAHDRVFKMVDKNLSMKEVFTPANNLCGELILAVTRLTCCEDSDHQVKIRFDDIKRKLTDRRATCFAKGGGSGSDRIKKAIEEALKGPLVSVELLRSAEGIIIDICGGKNLSMDEIKKGMEFLQAEVSDKVSMSFGITVDDGLKDRAQVCLIALGVDSDNAANSWGLSLEREDSRRGRLEAAGNKSKDGSQRPRRYRKAEQTMINFKQLSKGRFEKSKATIYEGIDLDIPTFLRKKR